MGTYHIDDASGRKTAPKMSAYPKRTRVFSEPITSTQDITIPKGIGLPDLIKKFYPGAIPTGFGGNFGFLERDNKTRDYEPGKADRYVFKNMRSVTLFAESAHRLMRHLCESWKALGLPLIRDDDRAIEVPDGGFALDALVKGHPANGIVVRNLNAIYFILANADIIKKACVVRSINAGWWAVSYAGKNAPDKSYFRVSLAAHKRAISAIIGSSKGRALYYKNWAGASDPLNSNPGYPFFTAQLDTDGNPVTRIRTVELFRNIGRLPKRSWQEVLDEVDVRGGRFGMPGFPFCVAPLRRLQPGYKWQHQFDITPSGLRTSHDERGVNSQRVAHMVPYVYNVLTTPVSTMYKTVRMLLPGAYHDGPAKALRMKRLAKAQTARSLFLAEADYSNFDRFMAVDLIEDIVSWFTDLTGNPAYWNPAMLYLHHDASLVWPDYSSVSSGSGWLFKPGKLGLLSGVKATSDTGTLVNSVVNGEALARSKGWSEDRLYQYLTQYIDKPTGSLEEFFYVQSDDTQLIESSASQLSIHGKEFMKAVQAAGLKGSIELADRFLMRHLQNGCDRPVPARVWQNTLSNETPPESEIIFLAGLGSRTDGLFGIKTVDPFQTGDLQQVTLAEATFTLLVIKELYNFLSTASSPSRVGINLLSAFIDGEGPRIESMSSTDQSALFQATPGTALAVGDYRRGITKALAEVQLAEASKTSLSSVTAWLYQLYKDQNIPSTMLMIEQLGRLDGSLAQQFASFKSKEEGFFRYAADTIGVKPPSI